MFIRTVLAVLVFHVALQAETSYHPLYLIKSGNETEALEAYLKSSEKEGRYDFQLLRQMAHSLLEIGSRSDDPEVQLLACYGAALSGDELALKIFEKCVTTPVPELQMACLRVLAAMQNDAADQILLLGMSSNNLLIRLETLQLMAIKKMPGAALQAEALLVKIPKEGYPLFAPFFACIGDTASLKMLRKFLNDSSVDIRTSAIHAIATQKIDSFQTQIRRFLMQPNPLTLEAAAYAAGVFQDEKSRKDLERLQENSHVEVSLAASYSLYRLGSKEGADTIIARAKEGNLFAIALLGNIEGSEDLLASLAASNDTTIKVNAAIALLERKDERCVEPLVMTLLKDQRDVALIPLVSKGKTLQAWKVIPSSKQNFKEDSNLQEVALRAKESLIVKMSDLPLPAFLGFSERVLKSHQNLIIPIVVRLLELNGSKEAIAVLEKYQHALGAPFIRRCCLLALYRIDPKDERADDVHSWVSEKSEVPLIRFRPLVPNADSPTAYQLTPEESSKLVVESLEALINEKDPSAIQLLINAMIEGEPKNRYALAGLLIRATH